MAGTVARTIGSPLALPSTQYLRHLLLVNLLQRAPDKVTNRAVASLKFSPELRSPQSPMHSGHGVVLPSLRMVDGETA